jgi:hypothetical protein
MKPENWVTTARQQLANDARAQPWKRVLSEMIPELEDTKKPNYIVITLENNVQENGRSP